MKSLKWIILAQGTYTLITAIWPLIHIESFMEVTGYKTDIWLVKMVGALLLPVVASLFMYLVIPSDPRPAIVLGCFSTVSFIVIDFYYSLTDVISDIYMVDGFL